MRIKTSGMAVAALFGAIHVALAQQKPAQPRSHQSAQKEEIKDSLKVSAGRTVAVLEAAQGWVKSNSGKWISSPGRIPFQDPDYNNEFYEKNLIGTENFRQIRVMEIKVDQKPYYALIVQHTKGYYKDPEKREDWKYFSGADYYLIDKADLRRLLDDSLQYGTPYTASLRSHYSGTVPYQNVGQLGARIGKDINTNIRTRHLYDTSVYTYYQFSVMPVKDKRGRHIRFNMHLDYAHSSSEPREADYTLFKSQYYEVPFDRFRAFARAK